MLSKTMLKKAAIAAISAASMAEATGSPVRLVGDVAGWRLAMIARCMELTHPTQRSGRAAARQLGRGWPGVQWAVGRKRLAQPNASRDRLKRLVG